MSPLLMCVASYQKNTRALAHISGVISHLHALSGNEATDASDDSKAPQEGRRQPLQVSSYSSSSTLGFSSEVLQTLVEAANGFSISHGIRSPCPFVACAYRILVNHLNLARPSPAWQQGTPPYPPLFTLDAFQNVLNNAFGILKLAGDTMGFVERRGTVNDAGVTSAYRP